jgi:catechol 2,3-dioxygenase-like lactoylglutathione lyase family enzyme
MNDPSYRYGFSVQSKRGGMNHLRLTVSDITRAEAYYTPIAGLMGYRLVEKSEKRLSFAALTDRGNLRFLILSQATTDLTHDRNAPGLHHMAWNADSRTDVDAMHNLLKSLGAEILDAPADYSYEPGYYAVFFSDPDGLKLEYVYVPTAGSEVYASLFEALGLNPLDRVDMSAGCCPSRTSP